MIDSKIQWCNDTVNIVKGCEQVDTDCRACYAMGIAARFAHHRSRALERLGLRAWLDTTYPHRDPATVGRRGDVRATTPASRQDRPAR